MPTVLSSLEIDLRWLCAIAGLGTLFYAIYRMILAQGQPGGHHTGAAHQVLRRRYIAAASLVFFALGVFLWKPIDLYLPWGLSLIVSILGSLVFLLGLGLYLWGLFTLGQSFNASSGFGVRLQRSHQLVTRGPYAYIRHPMYAGVIAAMWGGLLLYRTWTMLLFAVMMFGLVVRADREDQALGEVFGRQYELYRRHIPAWMPHLHELLWRTKKGSLPK
jgi:protein-S-isoprenylcysteine O-methyltransferase Ste14